MDDEEERDIGWKKPAWTQNAGLKKTGKGEAAKQGSNLASPITSLPHQKEDGPFQKPEWTDDVRQSSVGDQNLAKPITDLPHQKVEEKDVGFKKPEWTRSGKACNRITAC